MRALVAAGAVVLAGLAAGCGGSSLDSEQMSAYVNAQAKALCVVQSNAYPSQADQEVAYRKALDSSKLDEGDMAKAEKAAKDDAAVRAQISKQVAALCG